MNMISGVMRPLRRQSGEPQVGDPPERARGDDATVKTAPELGRSPVWLTPPPPASTRTYGRRRST